VKDSIKVEISDCAMLTSKPRPTSQVFNEVNDESTAAAPSESG